MLLLSYCLCVHILNNNKTCPSGPWTSEPYPAVALKQSQASQYLCSIDISAAFERLLTSPCVFTSMNMINLVSEAKLIRFSSVLSVTALPRKLHSSWKGYQETHHALNSYCHYVSALETVKYIWASERLMGVKWFTEQEIGAQARLQLRSQMLCWFWPQSLQWYWTCNIYFVILGMKYTVQSIFYFQNSQLRWIFSFNTAGNTRQAKVSKQRNELRTDFE